MREINDTTWLGSLPDGWTTIELGLVYDERKVKIKEQGYEPLSVTMNGIVPQLASAVKAAEDSDRKLVMSGDFVINSRSDRKGACGISPSDGSCSVINIVITPKECICSDYYNYVLLSSYFPEEFYRWGHGIASDLWTTRWQEMRKIQLPHPPVDEQKKIAQFIKKKLSELEALINRTNPILGYYKELKNVYIERCVTQGITPNVATKRSIERAFGNIPKHWNEYKIKRIFDICKEIAGHEGIQVLSITQKGIVPKDLSKNEGQTAADYSNYQYVHVGDFAMNHMDLRTGWVDLSKYEGVTSPDYRVFRIKDSTRFCDRFYKYVMQYCYIKEVFYSAAQGINENGRYRLKPDVFLHFDIIAPPYEEQCAIADYLDGKITAIDSIIAQKEAMLEKLKNYKKSLIYEYVTGKKEVPQT